MRESQERLLRLNEVLKRVGVSRSTWYLNLKKGLYPRPIKIGRRAVAWRESQIDALVEKGIDLNAD